MQNIEINSSSTSSSLSLKCCWRDKINSFSLISSSSSSISSKSSLIVNYNLKWIAAYTLILFVLVLDCSVQANLNNINLQHDNHSNLTGSFSNIKNKDNNIVIDDNNKKLPSTKPIDVVYDKNKNAETAIQTDKMFLIFNQTVSLFTIIVSLSIICISSFLIFALSIMNKSSTINNNNNNGTNKKKESTNEDNQNWDKITRYLGKGIDYQQQSIPYKDDETIRISKLLEHKPELLSYQYENVLTMNDIFERGHQQSKNGKCLGQVNYETKTIEWITYSDVLRRTKLLADGFLALPGLEFGNKGRLGIYSKNCPEYVLAEYACYRHSMIVIPIYDTLGPNVASFIANQSELTTIVCDQPERIENIIEQAESFQTLKSLILLKSHLIDENLRQKVAEKGFKLYSLDEIEILGKENPQEDHKPSVKDLAIICYTSGTTSTPKGVILTHENVIASVASISIHLMDQHATVDDVMISILPLAHMFQRIGEASVFTEGGKVCYYSGDIRQLASEILIIRPSVMLAVPRLLNRIHDAIHAKARDSILKRALLQLAYRQKRKHLLSHMINNNTIWDRLVFNRVRQNMGSRIRLICVGSAPLSPEVLDFLRVAIGCVISEGYGQTECVGPCSATLMGDETTGHVGAPLVGSMVRLADVPDMNYYAKDGRGEILVKGPVVFQGYYQMPEQTKETLDSDGWLHTGDIGYWNPNGTLRLIDRKKNIFKLSQGEYIAPEKIENNLINSQMVQQLFVYGDGFKSMLIAIVVPDLEYIQFTQKNNHNGKYSQLISWDEQQLNQDRQLKEIILDDFKRLGTQFDLKSFELPKNIYIRKEPFTIEEGFLTPTLKSKRNVISKHFEKQIQMLYKELELTKPKPTTSAPITSSSSTKSTKTTTTQSRTY